MGYLLASMANHISTLVLTYGVLGGAGIGIRFDSNCLHFDDARHRQPNRYLPHRILPVWVLSWGLASYGSDHHPALF
jgi:hypothetical protein